MNCRHGWKQEDIDALSKRIDSFKRGSSTGDVAYQNFIKRERIESQAALCEGSNHWAMAAILWRRLNKNDQAERCEVIVQKFAENESFKLEKRSPIIVKGV